MEIVFFGVILQPKFYFKQIKKMDFKFYIPNLNIHKATTNGGSKNFKISGIASTPTKDKEGDVIEQNFDLSEFKWINYEHGKNPNEIIGEITKARVTKLGLEIEGELYADNELAKEVYGLAMNMQKAGNGKKLGLSVEGRTIERDSKDKSTVKKAQLFAVAICKTPMNGDTFVDITKSLKQHNNQNKSQKMENTALKDFNEFEIQKAYDLISNQDDLEKGYKKGMKKEVEINLDGKNEEDEEEETMDMSEEEMKKAVAFVKDLQSKGRAKEQIVKAFNLAYANETEFTEAQIMSILGKGESLAKQEKAKDIVKGYIDDKFGALGTIFKGFEKNQNALLEKIEDLQSQVDAFGHKAGLGKSEQFAKAVGAKQSPMDADKTLNLRIASHKKITSDLLEKHVNLDSASLLEITGYISPEHKEVLKKAVGVEIVG